ncbi:MAG TPA: proton-conducting transporter membrane subunit [Elusimicrobiales bacterium]|mgnify:CR=1 FL=1|nr:proton-conducting transporter membrane subunit [Elusimicrobiales bacterium]
MDHSAKLLIIAVALPIFGAFTLPLANKISTSARNSLAVFLGLFTFLAAALLFRPVCLGQVVAIAVPFPLGFDLILQADMLSVFMASISAFVSAIILIYSLDYISHYENQTEYYTMVVLFLGSMMGLVFSANLLWLYIFWEMTAFASWRLVGFFRSDRDVAKANKTILVTFFGAVCMLLGIVIVYFEYGTLDLNALHGEAISAVAAALILAGIFSKSATLPFSTWLPDAGVAPSTVTALLHAAVLVKIGVYAYARIFGVTFAAPDGFMTAVLYLAGASALVSAGAAMVETDIKRIIAYSTVSQIAFIFLGLASGNKTAFAGALLYILMHSVAKGGLFLCAGIIEQNTHTKDITKMGGLFSSMPVTGTAFALCSLSVMGIPPFGGFFSKFLVFSGAAQNGNLPVLLMFLAGAVMTLLYLVRLFYKIFLGDNAGHNNPKEGSCTMVASVMALALIGLALGALIYYPSAYTQLLTANLGVNLQ